MRIRLPIAVCLFVPSLAWGADPVAFERDGRDFMKKYCYECHRGDKKEGELSLADYDTAQKVLGKPLIWEGIAKRVSGKEMPPEGSPQPSDEERQRFLSWIGTLPKPEKDCQNLATDATQNFYQGYVMSRRLTRGEYQNCVRDLFGTEINVLDLIPSDGAGGEGFDTNGSSLFTSSILTEKYLDAADRVVDSVLPDEATGDLLANRQRLLFAMPDANTPPREAAKKVLERQMVRAFRRPVSGEEVEKLLKLFDHATQRGDGYIAAMRLAFKGMIVSPHFLYLAEPEPEAEGVYRLGPYPLASRLSFFLWSSMPDDELLQAAADGSLHNEDVLLAQTRRMLKDPKGRALGENFALQWLGLTNFGEINRPDGGKFPEFTEDVARAMREETVLFCASVFQEDRSLKELIDADYTFVNEQLAKLYGLPPVEGAAMRRVSLTDKNRGGLITQGAVLVSTSYPLRTSPVLRGRWVAEEILGTKVPPPPPNVPSLPEHEEAGKEMTLRERLEQHRKNPECAACHQRMDPLGFGLENFDVLGRWRTESAGRPIDSSGKLPSGEEFSGPAQLKEILKKRSWDVEKSLTRKMLGYALGRGLNKFDNCVVDDTMKKLSAGGDKSSILIEEIVKSYPFQHRYAKK